jgi:hypothetical protein
MTRRKLFGAVAMSGLALWSVGTVVASASLAAEPAGGLTRAGSIRRATAASGGNSEFAGESIQCGARQAMEVNIAGRRPLPPEDVIGWSPLSENPAQCFHAGRI